jgi:diguanylate cyclase (GGDEF)-like protein
MRILIAEDDPGTRVLLETLLGEWGFRPIPVSDGTEAWKILGGLDAPRMALLDRVMPGVLGTEICRRVREREEREESYTYLILITGKGSADHVVEGLEAGADDYLVKPFHEHELRARANAGARIVRLQSELLKAKEKMADMARIDFLTGVPNRRTILSQLRRELNRANRGSLDLSLSVLDIDLFKQINDTYGHLAGDAVLKECVARIERVIRSYDSLGRFGGEEFLVILPETQISEALGICSRVQEVIAGEPFVVGDERIEVTVSQGVAGIDGEGTVDELIERADRALYRAKENGRNRVEWMDGA